MSKQVVVIMEKQYPFGQCEQMQTQMTRIVVRKRLPIFAYTRNSIVAKVNLLRRLQHDCIIKLNSLLQEQQSLHLLFQYVPIKVENWISNINDQFTESFKQQLIRFSNFLADNQIILQFRLANVGMDLAYKAKYFLNLDFQVDPTVNKEKLKLAYIRDINNIFKSNIQKSQEITASQTLNIQQGPSGPFRAQNDDPQFKKQNNYETDSVVISNASSHPNQAFLAKKLQSQQNKSLIPNSGSKKFDNPSIVKIVPDIAPTQLDDSYLKQFMDVLEIAQGQERQNDLLMSQTGTKTIKARDQHLYKTVYIRNQISNKQSANNRSFQNENNRKESQNLQNYQPLVFKKIHRSDSRRAQEIHSQVAVAVTNSLRVIDRFNNSRY